MPEVIDDGVTGSVVDTEGEAVQAIAHLDELGRRQVRARFEQRFTAERIAKGIAVTKRSYVQVAVSLSGQPYLQVAKQIVAARAPDLRIGPSGDASPGLTNQLPLREA